MKRPTRDLIRNLVQLVERDVAELRDSVAEVDERESGHYRATAATLSEYHGALAGVEAWIRRTDARVAELEAALADNANHSRRV